MQLLSRRDLSALMARAGEQEERLPERTLPAAPTKAAPSGAQARAGTAGLQAPRFATEAAPTRQWETLVLRAGRAETKRFPLPAEAGNRNPDKPQK